VDAIAVIIGVMLFLWSTAVIVTGFTMLIVEGRIDRRGRYLMIAAFAIFLGCIIGYTQLEPEVELPHPLDETAPTIP